MVLKLLDDVKTRIPVKTVVGFNESQKLHKNTVVPGHPESLERISAIKTLLEDTGLLDHQNCEVLTSFLDVDENDLNATHGMDYVSSVIKSEELEQSDLNKFCEQFDSVFMTKGSLSAAKEGVACCRELAEQVFEGKATNGFAIVRPPGHHADRIAANGFCMFNNAAQAAEAAFNVGADRILIVDLDVHHGQGTQRIFYDDKRVLYFSIHRYENAGYWPHLPESNFDFAGEGPGLGYNANLPLNETGCTDSDYMAILWNVLLPLAIQFDPQMVIVSAGFDSCVGDPVGLMSFTPNGYSHFIYQLKALAQGKLLMILEGGYNHEVSAVAAQRCLRVLLGQAPVPIDLTTPPKQSTIESCLSLISVLRNYWTCYDFYHSRSSARFSWDIYNPSCKLSIPSIEERKNTENIEQSELQKLECSAEEVDKIERTTLIAFDEDNDRHFDRSEEDHPEKPARTEKILALLKSTGLMDQCETMSNERIASRKEIEMAHERPLIDRMARTAQMNDDELDVEEDTLDSIYLTKNTFDVACKAVGCVLECVDRVYEQPAGAMNAFAVVRPPGHHASSSTSSGFCLYNNVAVAARYALENHGAKKILILDWDVHHGNGTQEIFYEDSNVLYMSVHRHDGGAFYPMGEPKDFFDVGEGSGRGFSVNVPFSSAKMGDLEYRAAFMKVIMPIAYEFNPDLVFISSGFDAAAGDPLGNYMVTPETFALMTYQLNGLAAGRTIVVLEGGYNLTAISESAVAVCEVLLHRAMVRRITPEKEQFASTKPKLASEAWSSLRKVSEKQAEFWTCLHGFQRQIGDVVLSSQVDRRGRATPRGGSRPASARTSRMSMPAMSSAAMSMTPRRSPRIAAKKNAYDDELAELERKMAGLSTK